MSEHESMWVLAYDAHCGECSGLAEEVARIADGRIACRSLTAPDIQVLRQRALGAGSPFVPTLLRVMGDDSVTAWTGSGLAVRLGRLLGPVKAARVLRVIGEKAQSNSPADPTRRKLLALLPKGALGLAVLTVGSLSPVIAGSGRPKVRDRIAVGTRPFDSRHGPTLQRRVNDLAAELDGAMTAAAFAWDRAERVDYEDGGSVVLVPAKAGFQTDLEHRILMAAVDEGSGNAGGLLLLQVVRNDASTTDRYMVNFADLAGVPIVGFNVDETKNEMRKVTYPNRHSMSNVVTAGIGPGVVASPGHGGGYWSCVANCLEWAWDSLPWYMKIACGGSFGACVYTGNPFACGVLAGCMGGIGAWCLVHC